ncbi:hypothetical protein DZ860_18280 [Vibrio sinensis]|uniref:KfrA N-terminal DNA-binding domain-containing protein n=1 Tax=Vibrio sinensis TaxID=2302434 RepID=A0A3A6Q8S9_9VIBR|nr:hypothetical protein [Vibrio sinensis]RJX67541.1 hypothetical protein DZ860_18280 [Vibrio sinensis]
MLTQDVSQELKDVLEQLDLEGKKPTVAMVKARLSTPIPIPALVSVIRSWKNTQHVPKVEVTSPKDSDSDKIKQLEQQVANLTQRLTMLEEKLSRFQ